MLLVVVVAGCGDDDAPREPTAAEVCDEYADVVARAFADCGVGTYEQNVQEFEAALPGLCVEADDIADRASLETECYPFFTEAECAVLTAPDIRDRVPDACRGQVLFEM